VTTSELIRLTFRTERRRAVKQTLLAMCRQMGMPCRNDELPDMTVPDFCRLREDLRRVA
jgi:hypothetical protein